MYLLTHGRRIESCVFVSSPYISKPEQPASALTIERPSARSDAEGQAAEELLGIGGGMIDGTYIKTTRE
jgi:hypothetical protein